MIFSSSSSSHLASPHPAQTQCNARRAGSHAQSLTLQSESLLRGQKIVEILHNGNLYKLQATKLGKLILTK